MTLDDEVGREIGDFGGFINDLEKVDKAKETERASMLTSAAYRMENGENYEKWLEFFRQNDTAYVSTVKDSIRNRVETVEPLYETNKGSIVNFVAEQINAQLAGAKAKIESGDHARAFGEQDAIKTLSKILEPVLNVTKPDAGYAVSLKKQRLAQGGRVRPSVLAGMTADADEEYNILLRTVAAEFVMGGDGEYRVNAGKLGEFMNYETGSRLYATAKQMEERAAYAQAA